MGLFRKSKEIQDPVLGQLRFRKPYTWEGRLQFDSDEVAIVIHGNSDNPM
jgi:hypothetical protein